MTEPTDRLTALERRVGSLEHRVNTETEFRLLLERDLGTIKQRQVTDGALLPTLHITQSHHTAMLAEHGRVLDAHGRTLAEHGLALSNLQGGVDRIIGMLDTLISSEGGKG